MALDRGIRYLDVYGDCALIISQIQGKYRTRDSKLQPCNKHLESVVSRFSYVEFHYLPREKKSFADAIAALACGYAVGRWFALIVQKREIPAYYCVMDLTAEEEGFPWYSYIWTIRTYGKYPPNTTPNPGVGSKKASCPIHRTGKLYKRHHSGHIDWLTPKHRIKIRFLIIESWKGTGPFSDRRNRLAWNDYLLRVSR